MSHPLRLSPRPTRKARELANAEHLDVLNQGAAAWSRWRRDSPGLVPDLSDADLRHTPLEGVDLAGANMTGCALTHGDLVEARLAGAGLDAADLQEAVLLRADLSEASLRAARMQQANLRGARMIDADVQEAALRDADLSGADLTGADLSDAFMFNVSLRAAVLPEATLLRANLYESVLASADLKNVDASGANMRDTDLTEVDLRGAVLNGADLKGAKMANADLRRAELVGADLSGADLTGANLSQCNLRKAIHAGATLVGSDMSDTSLREANLSGADLSAADLSNASLVAARLGGATFRDCRAHGVSLWAAEGVPAVQERLRISPEGTPLIAVDDLSLALFVQLMCQSAAVQAVVDEIKARIVLICGRYDDRRYADLDDVRAAVHAAGLQPVVFDLRGQIEEDTAAAFATLGAASRVVVFDVSDTGRPPEALVASLREMRAPTLPVVMRGRGSEWREMRDWRAAGADILPIEEYADPAGLAKVVGAALPTE